MKSYLLRLPDDLYRRVRIAAATACQPVRYWILDACRARLDAMPAQIPQRLLDKNPVPDPPSTADDPEHIPAETPAPVKSWF